MDDCGLEVGKENLKTVENIKPTQMKVRLSLNIM